MRKYTTTINDIRFDFDYARISNDGTMKIEFVNYIYRNLNNPKQIAMLTKNHSAYDEILRGLKECGALAPIVINKGA